MPEFLHPSRSTDRLNRYTLTRTNPAAADSCRRNRVYGAKSSRSRAMPQDYTVGENESVHSIAYENGFTWQTLWNHGKNAQLKQKRQDPDTLLAGDILHIPDITLKDVSKGSDAK